MKTFEEQYLKATNKEEFRSVISLLKEIVRPAFIILIGQYADVKILNSAEHGYDLVILTDEERSLPAVNVRNYITKKLPGCQEQNLHFYFIPLTFFNTEYFHNYFFYKILQEGVLLYQKQNLPIELVKHNKFRPKRALKKIHYDRKRYQELGDIFLSDAIKHLEKEEIRSSVFYTIQAIRQYLLDAVITFYGFEQNDAPRLIALYSLIRCSTDYFALLWEGDTESPLDFLYKLEKQNISSRFQRKFIVRLRVVNCYIRKAHELGLLTDRLYNERIEILQGMVAKENQKVPKSVTDLQKTNDSQKVQ